MRRRNRMHEIIKYKRAFDQDVRYAANVDTSLEYLLNSGVIPQDVDSYNENLDEDYSYVGLTDISERKKYYKDNIKEKSEHLDSVTYFDEELEQNFDEAKVIKKKKK